PATPAFQELAEKFLLPAGQVRPIAYVRADWFIWVATQPLFHQDFLQVPFKDRRAGPPIDPVVLGVVQRCRDGPVWLTAAAAELGASRSVEEVRAVLETAPLDKLGMKVLAAEGAVDRLTWESHFPQVVRTLGIGIPIFPLDALTHPAAPADLPPEVELKTNHANNVFAPKEKVQLIIHNHSKRDIYAELIGVGGRVEGIQKPTRIPAGQPWSIDVG